MTRFGELPDDRDDYDDGWVDEPSSYPEDDWDLDDLDRDE